MTKGTFVLTPFPFTDLTTTKRRPALIVSPNAHEADVIVAFISSRLYEPINATDFLIDVQDSDFADTGLKVTSIVKLSKLVTVEKSILLGELGSASNRIMKEIDQRLKLVFGL